MNRDEFLARVRTAAAAGRLHRAHVRHDLPPRVGYQGAGDDPVAQMAAEARAAGGEAVVVDDMQAARAALAQVLDQVAPRSALCWRHETLDRAGLAELLAERGVERLDHDSLSALDPNERRRRLLAADIGISSATYAVAETGTLAMSAAAGSERVVSLAPPLHVAIVERGQIMPDLFDLFDRLIERGVDRLPSNLALITGPSKTGDVELTLTTGVHGPGVWRLIVVR